MQVVQFTNKGYLQPRPLIYITLWGHSYQEAWNSTKPFVCVSPAN